MKKLPPIFLVLVLLINLSLYLLFPQKAKAAAFTETFLRLDRMKASTTTGGTVCAKPATTATEADVQVVFPTGFTVNTTAANWTVTTTNLPAGATAWVSIGTATAVSGQTVTFASGELVVGTLYCFNFAASSTLTTSTAGSDKTGTITTRTVTPTTIDTSSYAVAVISDDQIAVTATVPPIFSFTLGANTAALGTLSSSSVTSHAGIAATVGTNAETGWYIWVKSANVGLSSSVTGQTITSPGTSNDSPESLAGQEGYVLDANLTTDSGTGTGTVTIDAEFNGSDTNSGGHLSATFDEIASANGTTDGDVVTMVLRAKPSAIRAAATDYADTLTISASGRF